MHFDPVVKPSQLSIQRIKDNKRRRFLLAFVLLSALILLTVGLKDIDLKIAAPIHFEQQDGDSSSRIASLALNRTFIVVAFLLLSLMLLLILPYAFRKRAVAVLFLLSLLGFILYLYSSPGEKNPPAGVLTPAAQTEDLTPPAVNLTPAVDISPSVEFHPPQFSNLLLYLISLLVTLSFVFIIWMIYRWRRSQPSAEAAPPLVEIGEAARLALDDLAAGLDEKDVIVDCYARMSDIVMHSRQIERGLSRTATEFAARLESAGLPGDSVRRLTRLFEAVRYGMHTAQQIEIEEARECLTDIARFCGENA